VQNILAVTFIFGGGALFLLAVSPVGRAFADRLRHGPQPLHGGDTDPAVWEELDRLRSEVTELQERVDFAERLLAKGAESGIRDASTGQGS
jgi:hypothetical protein